MPSSPVPLCSGNAEAAAHPRCSAQLSFYSCSDCTPMWPIRHCLKEAYNNGQSTLAACFLPWLTLTANRKCRPVPIWSRCFPAVGLVKMQTRTRFDACMCRDRSRPDSAAGIHCGSTPQDAGQLQLVLRQQHPHPRPRNNQMDMRSLSRCQRALHGQRM